MPDRNDSKVWWQTLPAVLGGIAALITAITGLWLALRDPASEQSPLTRPAAPVTDARSDRQPPGNVQPVGELRLRIVAVPQSVTRGEKANIYVTVSDQTNSSVEGAKVLVEAGGGKFLETAETTYDPQANLMGPFSAAGYTSLNGVYTTWWVCNPCAPGYVIGVKASRDGYTDGVGDLTISIK